MEKKQFAPEYAIWERQGAKGTYLSMKTPDGQWVTFFKNNFAKGNQPQWKQAPPRPDANDKANSAANHNYGPAPAFNVDEDLPF